MEANHSTKLIVIVVGASVVVAAAWIGGRLSGRATGFGSNCEISTGKAPDGVPEARARCTWRLPVAQVDSVLGKWGAQAQYFSGVAESTVLSADGDRAFVRQVQRASGISDREAVLEVISERLPNGRRYRWQKAADQSGSSGKNIETAVHEGFWQIVAVGDETTVDYQLRYLPGGSVPSFVVSMFLASGVEGALSDLHRAAATQVASRNNEGG